MKSNNTGKVTLTEFRAWCALPGVAIAIGDRSETLRWCNAHFAEGFARPAETLIGKRYSEYLAPHVLEERRRLWQPMLERGERVEYDQLFNDRRVHTTCAPLHPDIQGPDTFIFRFMPEDVPPEGERDQIATTAIMKEFGVLSPAELRVLHAFAQGWSREEMARRLFRSPHTIQVHLKNIYAKLHIHREVELALRLGRSGLGAFSPGEWERIVEASTGQAAGADRAAPKGR